MRRGSRPLGPLNDELKPEMRNWTTRLRECYGTLDLTLGELERLLGADAATLSRYFSGQRLPELAFLSRLDRAVARTRGAGPRAEVMRPLRESYFEACAVHEPRRHQVYVLQEELARTGDRAEAAEVAVRDLEAQLRTERELREWAEASLHQLHQVHDELAPAAELESTYRELAIATEERDRLAHLVDRRTAELTEARRAHRAAEQARQQAELALHRAEQELERELERRWDAAAQAPAEDGPDFDRGLAAYASVDSLLINLSRRNQDLIQRQLTLISELESREADPDQLSSLFRLDHLATRMRRNGENLLVLAGEDAGRRWTRPALLVDVLRAAAAEVEQYERIELTAVPLTGVAGRVVGDLVHLVAELLENATSFSSPQTAVRATGHELPDGRVLIEIHDAGIGLTHHQLVEINEQLAAPPEVDMPVTDRTGLFVVRRLSQRHELRVQLRPSEAGGTTALVLLPVEAVQVRDGGGDPGR